MQSTENHVRSSEASTHPAGSNTGTRTWVLTLAISGMVLTTMYGLAYWNEARSEAARAQTISAPVTGTQ